MVLIKASLSKIIECFYHLNYLLYDSLKKISALKFNICT